MTSIPAPAEPTLPDGSPRPRYDLDAVVEVAVRVFTERGYDGTSMEQLSRASGLSKSSLYHHIESKEQLLRLALDRAVGPMHALLRDPGATSGPAVDRLAYVVRAMVALLARELPAVTLLLRVHGNTATERWALDQRRAFDRKVAGLVRDAIAAGDVRADADARTTARLVFGTVNSLVEWYRPRSAAETARLADQIVGLVFDGIRA
jgi:AcrR family transcriptional regulator